MDMLRTCVMPEGSFVSSVHLPFYTVINLRDTDFCSSLGHDTQGTDVRNNENFPEGDLEIKKAQPVYEILNPFPFWGATYILKNPAGHLAESPSEFCFKYEHEKEEDNGELIKELLKNNVLGKEGKPYGIYHLPRAAKIALAQTSRDPELLSVLASLSCVLEKDEAGMPVGVSFFKDEKGNPHPVINDMELYETIINNPDLPYEYKLAMVLKPGIQGKSPIVGEYRNEPFTHIWEYLRANSYIPWGHYAANMAHDCERYSVRNLSFKDFRGMRHLYYQRIYAQLSFSLEISLEIDRHALLTYEELDEIRLEVFDEISRRSKEGQSIPFNGNLWGWNYGYDFSPSGYRLNASHQQIHQQYALVPSFAANTSEDFDPMSAYAIGDQVSEFSTYYRNRHNKDFFFTYLSAIYSNSRLDGRDDLPSSLIIYEDENVLVHVPKAQRSHGEVQVMARAEVGNILEADSKTRESLDKGLHIAIKGLSLLGVEMATSYEVSKRFDHPDSDQRLFYCLLPRRPYSPGTFSEGQGRWVTGHYPEDYAQAFRMAAASVLDKQKS